MAFVIATRVAWVGVCAAFATTVVSSFAGVQLFHWAVPSERSPLCSLVFGVILGLTLGRLALVFVGLTIGFGMKGMILAAVILLVGGAALKRGRTAGSGTGFSEDWSDLRWLFALAAGVLLTITPPFGNVGWSTEAGYRFIPYFDYDFFTHLGIAAEVTRGLPPQNPYFAGEPLHYYWFYHLWPAAISILANVTAHDAVILTVPIDATLFVLSLGLLLRERTAAAMPRFLAIALGLFAYSYIGVLFLLRSAAGQDVRLARFSPRLSEFSLLSHSWFRDFLYEPHAVAALCGVVFVLYLERRWTAEPTSRLGALIALILGTMIATDTLVGAMAVCWWGLVAIRQFLQSPASRPSLLTSAATLVGLLAMAVWLGILPLHSGAMRIGVHSMARWAPFYLALELGPMFLFGTAGLLIAVRHRRVRLDDRWLLLGGVCLSLGFLLFAPVNPNLVLRKSLKVLQIPLVAFSASAFAWRWRRPLWLIGIALIVPAVLTLGTDTLQYVGVLQNPELPPTYVTEDEMRAVEWIRTQTSREAVFQSLDEVQPGKGFLDSSYSLVVSMGERRTLFGDYDQPYMFQVARAKIETRKALLERMFTAADAGELQRVLDAVEVDYLYVDERKRGPTDIVRDLETLGTLRRVHCFGTVCLFRLNRQTR